MIEIKQLGKTYKGGVQALHEINLTLNTGMFGLLGPNGAGKTTLMRTLAGILQPTCGQVTVFGHDLAVEEDKLKVKSMLGYLPQHSGVYPNLTAHEFLNFVASLKGIGANERLHEIERVLDVVRLSDVAHQRLRTFSGGMKRRISIAQALLNNPKLIIIDEPTTGLDPEERLRIRNTLARIAQNSIVMLSTHIIEDISQSCRSLAVISKGHILFKGAPMMLTQQAAGHVWIIRTQEDLPLDNLTLVSTQALIDTIQYRVIGQPPQGYQAQPADPTLEDGYLWLMQNHHASA